MNSFTRLWPRIISYVDIFVGWGRLLNFLCSWGRSFTWLWPRITILRVDLAFVCLSKLDDLFSRRICRSCVVQELFHILNLGPVFPVFPF